jgi:hypothetical protein
VPQTALDPATVRGPRDLDLAEEYAGRLPCRQQRRRRHAQLVSSPSEPELHYCPQTISVNPHTPVLADQGDRHDANPTGDATART